MQSSQHAEPNRIALPQNRNPVRLKGGEKERKSILDFSPRGYSAWRTEREEESATISKDLEAANPSEHSLQDLPHYRRGAVEVFLRFTSTNLRIISFQSLL